MNRASARILSNDEAGAGYRLLRLFSTVIASEAKPGQFVHVRIPDFDIAALRRPLSICDADPQSGTFSILYKVVGRGTEALSRARAGCDVDLIGPLGNGFPAPATGFQTVLVGGGYGAAPLYFLAKRVIAETGKNGSAESPVLFLGARSRADIVLEDRFRSLGVEVHIATDDGSLGVRGRVTDALDPWLRSGAGRPEIFACGPAPMLQALDERAVAAGFPAWLSFDRRMACGVGACFGCTQLVRNVETGIESLARVCLDGPVFPAGSIVWGDASIGSGAKSRA